MDAALIHASGLVALSLNIRGLVGSSDSSLRTSNGIASAVWAVNNALIGASSAAALSLVSVGRQVSAEAVAKQGNKVKHMACLAIVLITLAVSYFTWNAWTTFATACGSLVSTFAMFYLRGVKLRLAMVLVAALWLFNSIAYDSWWQMAANLCMGVAAMWGAWRASQVEP